MRFIEVKYSVYKDYCLNKFVTSFIRFIGVLTLYPQSRSYYYTKWKLPLNNHPQCRVSYNYFQPNRISNTNVVIRVINSVFHNYQTSVVLHSPVKLSLLPSLLFVSRTIARFLLPYLHSEYFYCCYYFMNEKNKLIEE